MPIRIPLSAPDITEADIEAVTNVLRSSRLSIGPVQEEFERAVSNYVGVKHAVAVSSGTAGLHLSLRALGIGEGDEVILPSFTFIAVAHAVRYERAVPVFAEIDPVTLNLDPQKIEERITPRTRAIVVVHTFGVPADLEPILKIAARHRLPVIEDACEALGAEYRGRKAGGIGRTGVFAFYPNKPITTAEGGMVVTDDDQLADTMRALRNQGRRESDGGSGHRLLGYNYRLSELHCALGLSQMRRLDRILERRRDRALHYAGALRNLPGVTLPLLDTPHGRACCFAFVIRVSDRDLLYQQLTGRGIGCAPYFPPIHRQPLYAPFATSDLPLTDQAAASTLALPFFNAITDEQITEVCEPIRQAVA